MRSIHSFVEIKYKKKSEQAFTVGEFLTHYSGSLYIYFFVSSSSIFLF